MKSGKRIIIIIVAILLIAIAVFFGWKMINQSNSVNLVEINKSDIVYYKLRKDGKVGVIDKDGNVVINPSYADVQIPNPTKDVFIVTDDANINSTKWKAVNSQNTQILTEFEDVEAISINQITSTVPYEKSVLKYKEGNVYGIIDFSGKKIVPAQYEEISNIDYKEGYLKVKKDGSYGIVNIEGKVLVKPEYNNVSADGFFNKDSKYEKAGFITQIKSDDGYRYGYVNSNGKSELENSYSEIVRLTDIEDENNAFLTTLTNGKYGLVKNGKNVLENEYESIEYDKETNLLIVGKNHKQGVYNLEGQAILPIEYAWINMGGDYINASKDNENLVFDSKGNKLDTKFTSHLKATNNYSVVIDENNNYNIADTKNNLLLNEKYIYIEYFKNDLFIATQGNNSGIINANGNVVVPFSYSTIQKIDGTELLAASLGENNRIDIINGSGKVVQGFENAMIEKNEKYIKIFSETNVMYFDLSGNQTTYKDLVPGNTIYAASQNGKWGFVDSKGNKVVDYVYDSVTEQNGNVAGVKTNGVWGIIDLTGKVILEPTYKLESANVKFLGTYYEINNYVGDIVYSGDVLE